MNLTAKKPLNRFAAFCAILFLSSVLFAETPSADDGYPEDLDFWSNYPNEELAQALVDRMTDSELLAQILMFGWSGSEPDSLLTSWVSQRSLGSVKVYGWDTNDTKQVAASVKLVQKLAQENRLKIPLYVATDQEGGWIRHIKGDTSDTPGNLAIGSSGIPSDAYYTGYYIGKEMAALGINMNFAPTVDVYTNMESSVIGPRSFGEDPEYVGILGAAFSKGSLDAGVIPTAKHFPGHGDTEADSHGNLPVINIGLDLLYERELVPYKYLIDWGIPAIMSGHLSFPQIVPNNEPASLSKVFLQDILRDSLGYEGLIITDDMMMNGATTYAGGLSIAVRYAIEAGNDIIISSTTPGLNEAIWRNNYNRMQSVPEFRECVKKAAHRVIKSKLDYFKGPNHVTLYPDENLVASKVPDPEGSEFFLQQACRSISVMGDDFEPYTPEEAAKERVLICGQFFSYTDELLKRYPHAGIFSYKYSMTASNVSQFLSDLPRSYRNFDTIIICVANEESAILARSLKDCGKKVIVISILAPVFVADMDWADTVLFAYSYSDYSFKAVASVLAGEIPVFGKLPLTMD